MQELWQDITTAALLGTERQLGSLPPTGGALGDVLARLDMSKSEKALLSAAAAISLAMRAGQIAAQNTQPLPTPCTLEDLPVVSPNVSQLLGMILDGKYGTAISEALSAIAKRNLRVPETLLPLLLDYGRQQTQVRYLITDVIGQRGKWLSALKPDWNYIAGDDEEFVWEEGKKSARQALLQKKRAIDPDKARELVMATWTTEGADARTAFLETFQTRLSQADEPFLEAALDDRSKEVRRVAVDLLAQIPESQFVARMQVRAEPLLQWKHKLIGKDTLEVTPPDAFDPAMVRDGIEQKPSQGVGEKAWWLQQILSSIPPSHWSSTWKQKPEVLIQAALKSEWSVPLLMAWNTAAQRHRDTEWLETLARLSFSEPKAMQKAGVGRVNSALIPADRAEIIIFELLEPRNLFSQPSDKTEPLHDAHPAMTMLNQHVHPWSDKLSRAVIQSIRKRFDATPNQQIRTWSLNYSLKNYAYYMSPSLVDEFSQGWNDASPIWNQWNSGVTEFLDILKFRRDLHKEINQ